MFLKDKNNFAVGSADKLITARTINGTSFNGTANITTANWGTARNIAIASSDGTGASSAVSVNGSANATLKLPATIKAALTGNATTATKLQTARTINGVAFDGSANITIPISSHTHNIIDTQADKTVPTGRNSFGAGAYTYGYYNSGGPGPYGEVMSFGSGTGGHSEIAVSWSGTPRMYIRSLRDTTDNWTAWHEVYTTGNPHNHTTMTGDNGFICGNAMYGTNDIGISGNHSGGSASIGSPAVWIKANNYFDNTSDRFMNGNTRATQLYISNGDGPYVRHSTNTPTADGAINWGETFYLYHKGNAYNLSGVSHCGWGTGDNHRPLNISSLAYWNGAYGADNKSNLQYCDRGRFQSGAVTNMGLFSTNGGQDFLARGKRAMVATESELILNYGPDFSRILTHGSVRINGDLSVGGVAYHDRHITINSTPVTVSSSAPGHGGVWIQI